MTGRSSFEELAWLPSIWNPARAVLEPLTKRAGFTRATLVSSMPKADWSTEGGGKTSSSQRTG